MREVILKTNLYFYSEYDEDEVVEKQPYEKPEEKDVGDDIDSDADTEYDEDEGVEMNIIDEDHGDVDVIDSDPNVIVIGIDFNFECNEDVVETVEMQVHKKPEKRDGARRPCSQSSQPGSTTPVTQSGTITPDVARYDSVPIVTLCVLKLTSQNLGVKLPEEECQAEQGDVPCEMSQAKLQHPREMTGDRLSSSLTRLMAKLNRGEQSEKMDVMGNINPNSKDNQGNVMKERVGDIYINPEGSYDEVNKMKERIGDMYEEPEKRDVMGNITPEGSYYEVNVRKEKVGDMYEKLQET
jgi:hypothetical protein